MRPPQRIKEASMDNVKLSPSDIAVALLRIFPPTICETILDEGTFRTRYGLRRDANIRFDPSRITLDRSKLFAAIRALFDTPSVSTELTDESGETWRLELDDKRERHVVLVRESNRVGLPDFRCLSPHS